MTGKNAAGKAQKFGDCFSADRAREVKSLAIAAAEIAKTIVLLQGFNAFGHHIHAEHAGQLADGFHDLQRLVAFGHPAYKRTIDLEHIEWKRVQVIERAVAGAEVVHEQRNAEAAQIAKDFECGGGVGHKAGLSHFEAELAAGDAEA